MPGLPSAWSADSIVSAGKLNYDMYTYDSNQFHPTGINFHTFKPLFFEVLVSDGVATTVAGGTSAYINTELFQGGGNSPSADPVAFDVYDTSGMWGAGGDFIQGAYQFLPTVQGSDGEGNIGGYYLMFHFVELAGQSATSEALGADLGYFGGSAAIINGGRQWMSTARNNCAMFMDLVPSGPNAPSPIGGANAGNGFLPSAGVLDSAASSTFKYTAMASSTTSSGELSRQYAMWAAVNGGTVQGTTASAWGTQSNPGTLQATWPVGTSLTDTLMTNALKQPLTWLGNPVAFRAATMINTTNSIASGGNGQKVNFVTGAGTVIYNANSAWNASTSTFTVPAGCGGLYLFHGVVAFALVGASEWANAGANINGTTYWGPSYYQGGGTAFNVCPTKTQIFSLEAGDTVQLWAYQNNGAAISTSTSISSRFMLLWLGSNGSMFSGTIGSPNTTYTPPDPSFRFQAGTPGNVLQHQFQQHLGNDIGFLFNKPYFMGFQTTASSLGTTGTFSGAIPLQSLTGIAHADNGDPWAGWNATNNNWTPPVSGWYLVVSEQTILNTNPPTDYVAGIGCTTSGGISPTANSGTSPDWYQHIADTNGAANFPTGATAAGLYYLEAGTTDNVFIDGRGNGQAAASSTKVFNTSPNRSTTHMEAIWVGA